MQALYSRYLADRFQVNRRYQRKLVWSVDEKERLIDSMLTNLPVPLFLVAETGVDADGQLEVIDGMQRLNAIFSFIENEFPLNDKYFDLDALADTKLRRDEGSLNQKHPKLSRDECLELVNYQLPLSVFRYEAPEVVDEAFRRINSGGRRLSPQELRQAGTLSPLADAVRRLSAQIRGDTSPSDIVPLSKMPALSITNRDLPYGVPVDEIFWVQHGILRREDLRVSADEELVLDLLVDCLADPLETSSTRNRNTYYNYTDDTPTHRGDEFASAIATYGEENLRNDFLATHDVLQSILPTRFATHLGLKGGGRAPRYWHTVFIAFYELMHKKRLSVGDPEAATAALKGISGTVLRIPGGSGNWTTESKRELISAVRGILEPHFEPTRASTDSSNYSWKSDFQRVLGNARIEQVLFEAKQGLLDLSSGERSHDLVPRLRKTLTAMCNHSPAAEGHVVIGVADHAEDAQKIFERDGVQAKRYRDFHVVGIEREARRMGVPLQQYVETFVTELTRGKDLDDHVKAEVRNSLKIVSYEGLAVLVLRVRAADRPLTLGEEFYIRDGSSTRKLRPSEFHRLYDAFRT